MSDRAYAQVVVYDCPEDQRAAALAAIYEAFDGESINERPSIDTAPDSRDVMAPGRFVPAADLVLGERYGDDDRSLDLNETLTDAIIAAAPGAIFAAWVDPKYEYPGALTMYAPELGRFDSVCDANGEAYIESGQVRHLLTDDQYTPESTITTLRAALGLPWGDAIDAARARLAAG